MNALNMMMMIDKLIAIINLKFSCTFAQLKKYLDLIEYLCQYIENYVIIFKSLQLKKIHLIKNIKKSKNLTCKQIVIKIYFDNVILKKLNAFHQF